MRACARPHPRQGRHGPTGMSQGRFDPVDLPLLVLRDGLLPETRQRGRSPGEGGPTAEPAELVQPAQEPRRERRPHVERRVRSPRASTASCRDGTASTTTTSPRRCASSSTTSTPVRSPTNGTPSATPATRSSRRCARQRQDRRSRHSNGSCARNSARAPFPDRRRGREDA